MATDDPTRAESAPQSHVWLLSDAEMHPAAVSVAPQPEARAVLVTVALTRAPRVLPAGGARLELLASIDDSLEICNALLRAAIAVRRGLP